MLNAKVNKTLKPSWKKSQYGNDYDKILLVIKYKSEVSIVQKLFQSIDKVLNTYRKLIQ